MNILKRGSILFILLFSQLLFSQKKTITGKVLDTFKKEIANVSITVYDTNSLISYGFTNEKGVFSISLDANYSKVKVVAQILGFSTSEKLISITQSNTNVTFFLEEKEEKLEEVVLETWQKIKEKKDTIVYKATAFKDGSEQVVEELLKNIPGLEITSKGDIKVNGKSIDKLLIEGEDLFSSKYKLLTKNLDASVINEVEIINGFEDNPVLRSFQKSEKVALNLKLKNDKRNIWFGNVDVGLGTKKRYDAKTNVGLLKKKIKFFNFINANNIGVRATSQVKNTSEIRSTAINTKTKVKKRNTSLVDIDNLPFSNFSKNEDVINQSVLSSLSFATNLFKKVKVRGLTYFTQDKIDKQNNTFTEYFIEPNPISFNEQNNVNLKDVSVATELELKYFSENQTYFTYELGFENNPVNTYRSLSLNNTPIYQTQKDKNYIFHNDFSITKQVSQKSILSFYSYYGQNNTRQNLFTNPNNFSAVFNNDNSLSVFQNTNTPLKYYGLVSKIQAKQKKSRYGIEVFGKVDKDKIVNDFNFENQASIDSLTFQTNYKKIQYGVKASYNYDISRVLRLGTKLSVIQKSLRLNTNKVNALFVLPQIRLHSKKTKLGNFGISYAYKNRVPTINYLASNFMLVNYRTFKRGLEDLTIASNHNFGFYYTLNRYKKQFLINSFLLHSFSNQGYGVNSVVNSTNNFLQYQIVDGVRLTTYNFSIAQYFRPLQSSFKLGTNHMWSSNNVFINNDLSLVKNYNASYRFQGTTYFRLPVNFKFRLQYNISKGGINNTKTFNDNFEGHLDVNLKLSSIWRMKLENGLYSINSKEYWFSNLNTTITPEKSRISYRVTFHNLIGVNRFNAIFINEFQRNETSYNVLPRYLLFGVKYRL